MSHLVPSEVYQQYTFLGIDPGLACCGISINNMVEGQLASLESLTLMNHKLSVLPEYPEDYHADRTLRMNRLCLAYTEILKYTNPIVVVCENPFYNSKMPSAYGALMETVTALRFTTYQYNLLIPFVTYSPQEVKQSFKRSGQKGKDVMKDSLLQNPELLAKLLTPVETLDEHGIDAIAVGQTWLNSQSQ